MKTEVLQDEYQAYQAIEQSLGEARQIGKYLVAVVVVEPDPERPDQERVRLVNRTTWQFPTGDFQTAVGLLRANLSEAVDAHPPEMPPLPMAPFLTAREDT